MNLKFDEKGLIPAIVQDARTGKVLMMAYMNEESLEITKKEGRACFWSRSRRELWRKGETSGNVQRLYHKDDCDGDCLLIDVSRPVQPAIREESCFFNEIHDGADVLLRGLYELIKGRKENPKEGSYTTYLFDKGLEKILKKVGEETSEVIIGAMKKSKEETIYEIADLAYHVMVLMAEMGISLNDIRAELASRHVIDKKTKQETMK